MEECIEKYGLDPSTNVLFHDKTFFRDIKSNSRKQDFLECLVICHTAMRDGNEYKTSSPDELALVNFAKFCGIEFLGTDEDNFMNVSFFGELRRYLILDILKFTSARKRMSVIVKDEDGRIILFCKGADNKIIQRSESCEDRNKFETMTQNLDRFACEGLRTLLVAKRELTQNEFSSFKKKLSLVNQDLKNKEEKVEKVQDLVERDLKILGATGIEDKLQDDVGVTISFMKKAGIKVWVLTGDKVETAKTIGISCQLLTPEMQMLEVTSSDAKDLQVQLKHLHALVCPPKKNTHSSDMNPFMSWTDPSQDLLDDKSSFLKTKRALVISGDALITISKKKSLLSKLAQISIKCEVVLCCRVSPKQKAEIVKMMKEALPSVRTLAIGDGANDVNMIIEAHIGVGIKGVEGQQAARASDYSIGEFKHLRKLLAVYGRESYRKNSVLVLYTFWKNILMVLPQFWYALLTFNFSGMSIYEKYLFQFVNLVFTAYPIILYAILDIEIEPSILLVHPKFYRAGLRKLYFNLHLFIFWMFKGLLHSFFIMLIVLISDLEVDQSGRNTGFFSSGMTTFIYGIVIANANILVISNSFYFLNIFCILGSIVLAFGGLKIFSVFPSTVHFGNFDTVMMADGFYSTLICCLVFITLFDYLFQIMQKMLFFEFIGVKFNIRKKKKGKFEENESKVDSVITNTSTIKI
jgi:phospholipid-transporting ATPase